MENKVRVRQGDANQILRERLISNREIDWKKTRAVVFLDPFGLQVPWSTIQDLAATHAIEVIINFPMGMAIQRFLECGGDIPPERQAILDEYFGTHDWYSAVYQIKQDLFDKKLEKVSDAGDRLTKWYRDRLRSAFGYAVTPRLVRNSNDGHLYYLLWAGPNGVGAKIADHILKGMSAVLKYKQ